MLFVMQLHTYIYIYIYAHVRMQHAHPDMLFVYSFAYVHMHRLNWVYFNPSINQQLVDRTLYITTLTLGYENNRPST